MAISSVSNYTHTTNLWNESEEAFNEVGDTLALYGEQDSRLLSEIFKMRVSQFDVMLLFFEVMKLDIKGKEQETLSRREERLSQISSMEKIIENRKSQASSIQTAGLSTGLLAITSGLLPIVGYTSGDFILQKLSSLITKLQGMDKDKFFESAARITNSMAEMSKMSGEARKSYAEGDLSFYQTMGDLHRTNWEENTRAIEERKEHWKSIENFLHQALQMNHEAVQGLYR